MVHGLVKVIKVIHSCIHVVIQTTFVNTCVEKEQALESDEIAFEFTSLFRHLTNFVTLGKLFHH